MNLHEYQAKEILRRYGIPSPNYQIASSLEEVEKMIELGMEEAVVKIQVHAGGRGKAGGVKRAGSPDEIRKAAAQLLGMKMVNEQTGPEGIIAHQIMLSSTIEIAGEFYLSATIDRDHAQAVLIASPAGGIEIEKVVEEDPGRLLKVPIGLYGDMKPYHLLRVAKFMGWNGPLAQEGMRIAANLAKAFIEEDAALCELNPLVITKDGKLSALDAKMAIDGNALFRHLEIGQLFDPTQQSPLEVMAQKYDLSYVALRGNIGCMVNGAGLAMAMMDMIHLCGGKPANFLDVGGSASKEKIAEGLKIILTHRDVRAVLINVFGGIMDCRTLAEGVLTGARECGIIEGDSRKLFIRMAGTNAEKGKELLQGSALPIVMDDDLVRVVKTAVVNVGNCADFNS